MRPSSTRNQIAKANTNRIKNIFATQSLIGREVAFQILINRKICARSRPYLQSHIGKVKEVIGSVVIIEGSRGELYNRPVDQVNILEAGG